MCSSLCLAHGREAADLKHVSEVCSDQACDRCIELRARRCVKLLLRRLPSRGIILTQQQ